MTKTDTNTVDVIVVGAGLAGLVAAAKLEAHGLTTLVVEAFSEVGGHLRTRVIDGQVVELGAEHMTPKQRRIHGLAQELDLTIEASPLAGSPQLLWRTGKAPRVGRIPPLSASEMFFTARATLRLELLARRIPPITPWEAPDAAALDATSFGDWLAKEKVRGSGYRLMQAVQGGFATVPIEELSLLQVLRWASRANGFLQSYVKGSTLQIREGTQQLAIRLAERMRGQVVLNSPVKAVVQDDSGVTVDAGEQGSWRGRRAIIGVPISKMGVIEFDPPLDPEQQALYRELRFGKAAKVVGVAPETPWVKHRVTLGGAPVEAAWLRGRAATGLATWESAAAGPEALTNDLAGLFGLDPSRLQAQSVEWAAQPFTGGSYLAWRPGQLVRHGPHLNRPHGLVHFAGADRSSWTGMEGAIENAEQVAEAVREDLAR